MENFYIKNYICLLFIVSCGLIPVPPQKGEFCNPLSEIFECIKVDFNQKMIFVQDSIYPLKAKNIIEYSFLNDKKEKIYLNVLHKHRVELIYPTSKRKFFLRIKYKK